MIASRHMNFKGLLLAATILPGPLILATPFPAAAQTGVVISVQVAPPILPVYAQPALPETGYIWTPGYWAWVESAGYYWVPGTWVQPPTAGVLWTPPYWGWGQGAYLFHAGYWGSQVGYYGGVNYGYGYGGVGFDGGRWDGSNFAYNQSVNNFGSVHVANVYQQNVTAVNNSQVSYAGGAGGLKSEPTAAERQAERENHVPATAEQTRHMTAAAANPDLAASHNGGHPAIAATARPGEFEGAGVVHPLPAAAHAAPAGEPVTHAAGTPADRGAERPGTQSAERPVGRAAGTPVAHAAARPLTGPAARPATESAARPAQHGEAVHPAVARDATPRRTVAPHEAAVPRAAPHQAAAPGAVPHEAAAPHAAPREAAAPRAAAPARAVMARAAPPPHVAPAHEEKPRDK
jgi:WXXGXW repeat (2 copies)